MKWLVVTLKRGRELDAQREIDQNGFRVFVPYYMKRIRSGRQWVKVARPLFGPYGFAEAREDEWHPLATTRHVTGILCWADGEPQWVPDECMSELLWAFGAGPVEFDEEVTPRFKKGVPIRITTGAHSGIKGLCVAHEGQRVRALFQYLGTEREVTLREDMVQLDSVVGND